MVTSKEQIFEYLDELSKKEECSVIVASVYLVEKYHITCGEAVDLIYEWFDVEETKQ